MSERNIQIVQQIYAAFGRGDVPAILEHLGDDLRHFGVVADRAEAPWHMQITRKQDVPRFFQALAETLEFTRLEPRDFVAGADLVYCTIGFDAIVKKNGRKVTLESSMHRFTLKDGRVVDWRGTEDTAKIRDALA